MNIRLFSVLQNYYKLLMTLTYGFIDNNAR